MATADASPADPALLNDKLESKEDLSSPVAAVAPAELQPSQEPQPAEPQPSGEVPSPAQLIRPRSRVWLRGLQGRADLNGREGTLGEWDDERGRYEVDLFEPRERVRIKIQNLAPIVLLQGLQDRAELNGREGVLLDWLEEDEIWEVELLQPEPERVRVSTQNLAPIVRTTQEVEEERKVLPPGWTEQLRETDTGRKYKVFSSPDGKLHRQSKAEAWEVHREQQGPAKAPAAPKAKKKPRASKKPQPPTHVLVRPSMPGLPVPVQRSLVVTCEFLQTFLAEALQERGHAPPTVTELHCALAAGHGDLVCAIHLALLHVVLDEDDLEAVETNGAEHAHEGDEGLRQLAAAGVARVDGHVHASGLRSLETRGCEERGWGGVHVRTMAPAERLELVSAGDARPAEPRRLPRSRRFAADR